MGTPTSSRRRARREHNGSVGSIEMILAVEDEIRRVIARCASRSLLKRCEVDDLFQETLIVAWRRDLNLPQCEKTMRRLILSIVRHVVFNRRRVEFASRRSPRPPEVSYSQSEKIREVLPASNLHEPDHLCQLFEVVGDLQRAIKERLDTMDRDLLDATFYRNQQRTKFAREREISRSTVHWRLQRTYESLKHGLKGDPFIPG